MQLFVSVLGVAAAETLKNRKDAGVTLCSQNSARNRKLIPLQVGKLFQIMSEHFVGNAFRQIAASVFQKRNQIVLSSTS